MVSRKAADVIRGLPPMPSAALHCRPIMFASSFAHFFIPLEISPAHSLKLPKPLADG
jgi:hypothetical protein